MFMDENMIEFKSLEEDSSFISKHSREFSIKYPKKFIAVFNGRLIFVGDNFELVMDKVKEFGEDASKVLIEYIPGNEEILYLIG